MIGYVAQTQIISKEIGEEGSRGLSTRQNSVAKKNS